MQMNEIVEITVDEFKEILETEGGVFEIETPNGWVEINEFYDRGKRESVEITTNSSSLKCSFDHLLFDKEGEWKKAEDFNVGDELRKKDSIEPIEAITKIGKVQVYDLWINSVEHAYFSNDFISHNCGKTELAKQIARNLGINLVRLNMSEYSEEYSTSKLIGSAAGYVGYEQSGALTEPLIQHPNSVVLLDEIEKANDTVYNLLLQVMDEGQLTDNHGREASFRNAIILMTSNVGVADSEKAKPNVGFVEIEGSSKEDKRKEILEEELKEEFSPEFRNRLTNIFYFNPVTEKTLFQIVDKNIRQLNETLTDKKVNITLTEKAKKHFVSVAKEENAGGRPVERIINEEVSEKVADEILFGKLENGGLVKVDYKSGKTELNFSLINENV